MEIKFKRKHNYRATIDIVPLLDIAFNLIAFFMITWRFSSVSSIDIQLPSASRVGEQKQSAFIIAINAKSEIFINDKKISPDSLIEEIKKKASQLTEKTVVIRGDKRADYQTVIKVMDSLNQAGFPKFTLTTLKKGAP